MNLAPVAAADPFRARTARSLMDVLANDSDPDGDTINLQSVPATVTFTNGVTVPLEVVGDERIRSPGAGSGAPRSLHVVEVRVCPRSRRR